MQMWPKKPFLRFRQSFSEDIVRKQQMICRTVEVHWRCADSSTANGFGMFWICLDCRFLENAQLGFSVFLRDEVLLDNKITAKSAPGGIPVI